MNRTMKQLETVRTRMQEIISENPEGLNEEAQDEFDKLEDETKSLRERQEWEEEIERMLANGTAIAVSGSFTPPGVDELGHPNPWTSRIDPHTRTGETRKQALTAVERWNADDGLKQNATTMLERLDSDDADPVGEFVIRTSNPLYVSAYAKYARNPEGYGAELEPDERRAWNEVRSYTRTALGLAGAVLPSPLDPSIVLSNAGTIDPMRTVARVDTTTANEKRYITSAGVTASFDAEFAEVSDDTPTLTEVTVTTRKAQAFVQASVEAWLDQVGFFDTEVARMFGDAKARLEGDKFVRGVAGSNEPIGIQTALAGGSSEIDAAGEAMVAADVYGLIEALPPRWQANAKWMAELSTLNHMEQFETSNGAKLFDQLGNSRLIRRSVVENSNVDPYSDVDDTATANNYVVFVGDWSQYVVCDRVGMFIEFLRPGHLVNTANNLPDGRVGAYGFWRVGADSLVDDAFRMLDVATTA